MLDNNGLETLRKELEAKNDGLWVELVTDIHGFTTREEEEAWFFFLIDEPANILKLADVYVQTVQSAVNEHYPDTQFFMGVYQHLDDKELFWGEVDSYDVRRGKLNEGFGHGPIVNPLPSPERDVFRT